MPVSSLDLDAAVDRYMNAAGYGRLLGFPFQPGQSSTTGTGVPTNGVKGWAPGAIFHNVKGTVGTLFYINIGTYDSSNWLNIDGPINTVGTLAVNGVAAGYKVARGVHTQVAAIDTVVTGLATVVAAVATFQSAPTVKQLFSSASIGNQAGAPAAGSILIATYKPTAVNDVTPTAATDFTDNLALGWLAVGT